eukprot:Seg7641.2 transcript_id=Seg7641.2/GoldUCD/mRNA.D3Y31 product="FAD synthase" protein_id=Seg7641.2/GoldUCD/D3Y31
MATKTAGIIIIGDEVLKGHTRDTNSAFLLSKLWSLGVRVEKVSTIPDEAESIAEEVKHFSAKYDIVITSGGIGPTHDDVTVSGIAQAIGEELENNEQMKNILEKVCASEETIVNDSILKMAMLPKSMLLRFPNDAGKNDKINFPLMNVHNIYIFPGIPEYLERSFLKFSYLFHAPESTFFLHKLYISVDESQIADALTAVDRTFPEDLHLGSYPFVNEKNYKVKVTLESGSEETIEKAYELLIQRLPTGSVLYVKKYSPNSREAYKEVFKPGHRVDRLTSVTEGK